MNGLLSGARKAIFVMEHMINEGRDAANAVFTSQKGGSRTNKKQKRKRKRQSKHRRRRRRPKKQSRRRRRSHKK